MAVADERPIYDPTDNHDPEAPPPFDPVAMLEDTERFLKRYVVFPSDDHVKAIALFIILTWCFEEDLWPQVVPYPYINGPSSAGKTTLLDMLECMVANPRRADDMTPAVMFKLIDKEHPTLLWDEIDTVWSGTRNEAKRRLVNTGYKFGGSAWREVARELHEYSTFCCKVLCGINNGMMPHTVLNRCIPITMRPKKEGEHVERFNQFAVKSDPERKRLCDAYMMFRELYLDDITAQRPEPLAVLADRQNEIVEPLLQIAGVINALRVNDNGEPYVVSALHDARKALQNVFAKSGRASRSPQQRILERIRDALGDEQSIWSADLCEKLGPSWTPKQLSLYLAEQFNIRPKAIRGGSDGQKVLKGYDRAAFEPAFEHYLDSINVDTESEE